MYIVLLDSRGGIAKLLFHHTSTYHQGRQVGRTLFGNLLRSLENIGTKPEVYAFATYRNDSERAFLQTEAENWKSFVRKLEYASIQVSNEMWSKLLMLRTHVLFWICKSRLPSSSNPYP